MLLDVSQFTSHTTENLCELYLWFKEHTLSYQDKRFFFHSMTAVGIKLLILWFLWVFNPFLLTLPTSSIFCIYILLFY